MLKNTLKVLVFLGGTLIGSCAFAGMAVIDNLSFGTIAVVNNTTTSDITITTLNNISFTNHIRELVPGHRGEYLLTGYPGWTELTTVVSVAVALTSSAGDSEQFTLVAVDTAPTVTTDGTGVATVYVGGTFRTSGSGTGQYLDTLFTATLDLDITF